ncbi:ABC transporter permease subunit [Anaerocolumna sedimenticola]|uniref:ABC transporter permease subunit n=1 Tax=Anaerocolumna sedimenticola TaxID=2696063 RepID=A0A6P1TPV4_9FIRM|nr:sugar ABC transporter permease [Anaerocolumna sedimenticola]QHQ62357.1 ABC transporter permease subunit [Anaerocolumna sedimenticola]
MEKRVSSEQKNIYPQWFLIIPLVLYVCFYLLPSLLGIFYSFTDWSNRTLSNGVHFVGLQNYIDIFTSNKNYVLGISHTVVFTIISNIVKLIPALLLAIMLQEGLKGKGLYRTLLYLPSILPFVIIGLVFKSILNYNTGLLNAILDALHLGILKQKWLSDLSVVWKSIYGVDAWRGIGYVMTIFLAGLNTIPKSYYEAAQIDGANFWQRLVHITLPMLSGAIMINLVFGITYGLKVFDIIYVLTNGGPGHATEVLTTYSYQLYSSGQYGMSTALNAILLIITAVIGVLVVRVMSKKEVQQ